MQEKETSKAERVDRNAQKREEERLRREREAIAEIAGLPPAEKKVEREKE